MAASSVILSRWDLSCEGSVNKQTLHWQETLFPIPDLGWISTRCSLCIYVWDRLLCQRGIVGLSSGSEYYSACFPMWVITCRRYGSVLFFSFFPSDLKDGRLCRGADRQSFSTRRLSAASHTRPCSEIVRLCCDSPADGFYCLNLETSFCQWVAGTMCSSKRRFCKSKASVSPLDLSSVFKVMLLARDGWQIIVTRVRVSRSSHSGPTLDSAVINQQAESRLWVIIPTEWLDGPCGGLFYAATERKNPAYSPPLGCLSQSSTCQEFKRIGPQRG